MSLTKNNKEKQKIWTKNNKERDFFLSEVEKFKKQDITYMFKPFLTLMPLWLLMSKSSECYFNQEYANAICFYLRIQLESSPTYNKINDSEFSMFSID